jgi:hypothetical protein
MLLTITYVRCTYEYVLIELKQENNEKHLKVEHQ